jgi:hypothetical protein
MEIADNFIEKEEIIDKHLLTNLKVDEINNLDLRSDLENANIFGCVLRTQGYIGNRPRDFKGDFHEDDTWAIGCFTEDGNVVTSYLYVSQYEYNQDVSRIFKD